MSRLLRATLPCAFALYVLVGHSLLAGHGPLAAPGLLAAPATPGDDDPPAAGDEPAAAGDEPAAAGDEPAAGGDEPAAEAEDPKVAERKKRLELDERRETLPDTALPAMIKLDAFRDREFRVWSSLRKEVVRLGSVAIPALEIALDELDWETRAFAASCLADMRDPSTAGLLGDAYDAEVKFVEAKRQILLALVSIGAKSSRDLYVRAAADGDPGLRLAAVRGLGALDDPAVVETLRGFVESEDLDVRYEALGGLAALKDKAATKRLIDEAKSLVASRQLERVASTEQEDNGDRYSHYLLGLALARIEYGEADKILVKALTATKPYDHKAFLRMGVAEGLGRRAAAGSPPHPKLVSGISHRKDEVRVACTYGAGWAGSADLVGKLTKALGDSQLDVRHNAVMALGRIGNVTAVKALKKSLSDKRGEVRIGAIRALAGIDLPESTAALLPAVRDQKYMVRVMAVRSLRYRTEQDGVLKVLIGRTKDADYGVREQALAALAHHPDGTDVLDALAGGLNDKDDGVKTNACLGLAKVALSAPVGEAEAAMERVVYLYLDTTHARLKKASLECLDAARPAPAVDPLISALGHDLVEVRRRANRALQTISETSRGFDPEGPAHDRSDAVKRWREWWAGRNGVLPARGARARGAITGALQDTARDLKWKGLDIALLFDSTGSMAGLIRAAKQRTDEIIHELNALLPSLRVSVYTYRDYGDNYVWYGSPLTYDTWKLSGFLQNATHGQGGDLPEAVFETTRNAMMKLDWRPEAHKVIVYAGDAPHHPESHGVFIETIKEFCTVENNAVLHAVFTDTNRRSLDIKTRKRRIDASGIKAPFFDRYAETAAAGRGRAVMLDDESALIKELLVLTFGESFRADIENLLDFEY